MVRWLRTISFFLLFGLCFLPLGSCAIKTEKGANGGVSTSFHALNRLSNHELSGAEISSVKIYKSPEELDPGEDSGWDLYLIALVISFVSTRIRRLAIIVKPLGFLATALFAMIYLFYAFLSITSPTTTLYGWLFVVAGMVYLGSWVRVLIPGFVFASRNP
ncbi:MAG: hypothetical protein R3F47_20335 [Gammaproteobacteria bacterium]